LILEKALDITWYAISRADYIDGEMLYWMRKAGCIQISYGVESGSKEIRSVLGKKLAGDRVKNAFSQTHRYGILARAYFIYGSPGETWETIEDTIALIKDIRPFDCISYILEIYPGTALYRDYRERCGHSDDVWLKKQEGICYFETDPALSQEIVMAFGKAIRDAAHGNLHDFVEKLDLVDREDLFPLHADFCSRLGMTFTHGKYSQLHAVKKKDECAEKLFRKALTFWPDHRAFLGLGLLLQRQGDLAQAVAVLEEGAGHFPHSEDLGVCRAVVYMNLGQFEKALEILMGFEGSSNAAPYIASCYQALGKPEKAAGNTDKKPHPVK
jgi:tetratricopeptide (TPR) repeat protein